MRSIGQYVRDIYSPCRILRVVLERLEKIRKLRRIRRQKRKSGKSKSQCISTKEQKIQLLGMRQRGVFQKRSKMTMHLTKCIKELITLKKKGKLSTRGKGYLQTYVIYGEPWNTVNQDDRKREIRDVEREDPLSVVRTSLKDSQSRKHSSHRHRHDDERKHKKHRHVSIYRRVLMCRVTLGL